jgi:exopolysaccharide production protein ExoZ
VVLSLFFVPHLDPAGIPFPFLPPGWTLNYEAILYLIFTGSLLCPRRWRLRVVVGALCAILIVGLFVTPLFPLFANPLMLEFVAGVLLAKATERGGTLTLGLGWSLIALGLVCFAILRLLGIHSDIGRWFLWGAPAVLIVSGALAVEARGGLPRIPALKRIGDASYSIYLCHWPIIVLAARVAGADRAWPFVVLSALAAVLAGLLVHIALEKPMLRRLQRRPSVAALSVP